MSKTYPVRFSIKCPALGDIVFQRCNREGRQVALPRKNLFDFPEYKTVGCYDFYEATAILDGNVHIHTDIKLATFDTELTDEDVSDALVKLNKRSTQIRMQQCLNREVKQISSQEKGMFARLVTWLRS